MVSIPDLCILTYFFLYVILLNYFQNFKSSFGAPRFVPQIFVISAKLKNIEQNDQSQNTFE